MKPFPLLLAAATLLLAGCFGAPGDPVDAAAVDATNATSPAAQADAATLAAGNASVAPVASPFAFDGKVPVFAEACFFAVQVGDCVSVLPTADFAGARYEATPGGALVAATATATWTAAAPTAQEMVVFAYSTDGETWQAHGWAMGPPGITLELEELDAFVPGGTLYVGLSVPSRGAGAEGVAAWGAASPAEQPFHLEGVLTTQAPAAG